MYCKNCGKEIGKDNKFCTNCGYKSNGEPQSLNGAKISTPLFILLNIVTLGIYGIVKWCDLIEKIKKIIPEDEAVSPIIISSLCISYAYCLIDILISIGNFDSMFAIYLRSGLYNITYIVTMILIYYYTVERTLNNITKIIRIKQNKDFHYNKFWAFIFNIIYINYVLNTFNEKPV